MSSRELGTWGEEKAAGFLRRKGYTIVERNYSCRFGEIDLIARRRDVIAFIEVKLRKNANFAQAREFVTYGKQQRIIRSASLWLAAHPTELQPRFDVIEIYAPEGMDSGKLTIHHLEDAFC